MPASMPSRARRADSIQARSDGSGDVLENGLGDAGPRRRLVVGLHQPGSPTHHLAEGPEGDAVAVRRAAAGVPPDAVEQAIQVLEELPGQASLADAARADDADQARPPLPAGGLEEVLELAELLVPTDERCLERVAAVLAAPLGDHPDGPPGVHRSVLALELVLARVLEDDGAGRRSFGRLADQHRPWLRRRLEPRGGVDEVARHHALVRGADGDGRLAGEDAGARLDAGAQRPDRVDQVEARPDGPLGVILVGERSAPHGHHGVADELLDAAAVLADDVAGEVEVASQRLAHVLGIARGRERREAHQIGEQDADEAALGAGCRLRESPIGRWRLRARPLRQASMPPAGLPRRVAPHTPSRTSRRERWSIRTTGRSAPEVSRTRRRTSRRVDSRCRNSGRSRGRGPPADDGVVGCSVQKSSRARSRPAQPGGMFWLLRKRLVGS